MDIQSTFRRDAAAYRRAIETLEFDEETRIGEILVDHTTESLGSDAALISPPMALMACMWRGATNPARLSTQRTT